tara:strand:- start:1214 stop:1768 length:555 start_codon:yes stop_codon:yes gene_type:complete
MEFLPTKIPDVLIIKPIIHYDERGYFTESFRQDLLSEMIGGEINFIQDNESKSSFGTLRGLHYQLPPFAQSKLVRVIEGKVLDVCVDIRKSSPTFGQHVSVELSSDNNLQLFVPKGFAHGFIVLSKSATFTYKVDNYYSPNHERGIAYDDIELSIDWKTSAEKINVSKKDDNNPSLSNSRELFD